MLGGFHLLEISDADPLMFHHVQADDELDSILAPGGAMEALADGLLWEHPEQALRYAWSLPVDVVAVGFNTMEMLRTDLAIAERFVPMGKDEREEVIGAKLDNAHYKLTREVTSSMPV